MTNDEIFARIAQDVSDVYKGCFGVRGITVWMTKGLFNRLCPDQFLLNRNTAAITIFGCNIKVVILPCDELQWIVGYEGTVEEERQEPT